MDKTITLEFPAKKLEALAHFLKKPAPRSRLPFGRVRRCPPPGLRCRVGRFAAERHRRSLTPSRAHT